MLHKSFTLSFKQVAWVPKAKTHINSLRQKPMKHCTRVALIRIGMRPKKKTTPPYHARITNLMPLYPPSLIVEFTLLNVITTKQRKIYTKGLYMISKWQHTRNTFQITWTCNNPTKNNKIVHLLLRDHAMRYVFW